MFSHYKLKLIVVIACLTATPGIFAVEAACNCNEDDPYPTATIADYVLGCMAANGNTFQSLHQCSCSIDFIKSKMSYKDFEKAQTVMQAQRDRGQRGIFFRDSNWAKKRVQELEKYQAESTLRCF